MNLNIIILLLVYAIVLILIALWDRKKSVSTGDEYLMAGRNAPPYQVAAALFTLIGGGELVTMVSLGYTFGFGGIALFLGYALAFIFVGTMAFKVRDEYDAKQYLSLPDYIHYKFGKSVGHLVFLISFVAFFALLLLQFTAGGQLLSSLLNVNYTVAVIITALIAFTYLFIGGFRSVLRTDAFQGVAMLLLLPLLIYILANTNGSEVATEVESESLPLFLWVSLTITGFFVGSSSSDVWQRAYAAKSNKDAMKGFIIGSIVLLFFGGLLIWLGIEARSISAVSGGDSALVEIIQEVLPGIFSLVAIILILSAVISTADTEIFLLSGLAVREQLHIKGLSGIDIKNNETVKSTRIWMVAVSISSVLTGLYFSDLIEIYTWLLSALMILSPTIIAALLGFIHKYASYISIIIGVISFILLAMMGKLTLDNSYLIVLISGLVYITIYYLIPFEWANKKSK